MNAGCVQVDGALDNPTEFLCFGMERKHLTKFLELKGQSDRNEGTFSSNLQRTNDPDLCDLWLKDEISTHFQPISLLLSPISAEI